ncbi:hypothetical protein [Caulobacter sp. 17J65-9]|uniref:hypothetical protein n=1 Tax=Caulobacter sp. 17J65-9 TaxID=2709382 RepID=UPI0013C5C1F8|nr:hypothetical protein [Caulobacter sp. 17J65-9]NEX92954.1 hypothetical protein [Caulobacter sp. 17J65-9]
MKAFALAVCAAALAAATGAQAQDWRAAAGQDLAKMRELLKADHPAAYVDKDGGTFRSWVDTGYEQVSASLDKVADTSGYYYALNGYAGGFRDGNIRVVRTLPALDPSFAGAWPGFSTAWRDGAYTVAWSEGGSKTPPVGAKLISCDKKPAEAIARERLDRWEGDLELQADRARTAPYLLWDRGNPFAGAKPTKCDFDVAGRKKSFTLTYGFTAEAQRKAAFQAATPLPERALSVEQWNDGYWIHLPSFADDMPWEAFLGQLEAQRAAIQNSKVVVIDMRGAGDGPGRHGYRVANWLWDPDFVLAHTPQFGDVAYRVSVDNRAFYAGVLANLKTDGKYYKEWARWEALLAEFDQALASGQPLLKRNEARAAVAETPANPMKAKVVVLTDAACARACLNMMDLFTRLPGVVHAGSVTSADSIFVGEAVSPLPSGFANLSIGDRAWLDRPRATHTPYTPSLAYSGDPADETAVRSWLAGAL